MSKNSDTPFKFEVIVTTTGDPWGYEVLFNHPTIPNEILFSSSNPALDLFLLKLFCERIIKTRSFQKYTFNISLQTILIHPDELDRILREHPELHLEITESQAFWQGTNLQTVKRFLERWPQRVFVDDFLKGGHGLQIIDELKPFLAGIKLDLRDAKKVSLAPEVKRNLMIVIEKVETPEDYDLARLKGATHLQGWLFKRRDPEKR